MARMEIISGVECRRRWSKEAKLAILAEADPPGVRIGDVTRRHDIYPAQIRLWRKTLSHFDVSASFLPVFRDQNAQRLAGWHAVFPPQGA
ncbi:transposase [Ensifer sp. Root31]|uniref:transposase n=1 Tax=Ensifer TaxID=106591 RepID=UPI0009E74E1A|nr:transposase [Ensifer sp. Root31]